jgi:hypothetical protein
MIWCPGSGEIPNPTHPTTTKTAPATIKPTVWYWRHATLRSGRPADVRGLRYSVAVEQFTGLAVLAIVALLGTIHPGR